MNDTDTILEIIYSYRKAQLIYVAARLNISDILDHGPKNCEEIARLTKTNKDSLYRVMRALSGIGFYKEHEDKSFELTPMGELLTENNKSGIKTIALMQLDENSWKTWGELLYSVQTGKSAFKKVFNKNLFEYLSEHPAKSREFNNVFKTYTTYWVESFLEKYDFTPYDIIADIGGSYGVLIKNILERYPGKKGILFDLPHVIREIREEFMEYKIVKQCDLVEGDFFKSIPRGCDLYTLKNIIHDWDDEHALKILNNCHKAMNHNSTLLLIENVLMNDSSQSPDASIIDICMLVGTIGGRERTKEEYSRLLLNSGFTSINITPDYIEAVKTD
ncbi:MAG: hypothetical protein JXJ04_15085 [Spirochaetales bacterium]|nr:hypothetical protein [Spirochaetales bacterium]